MLVPNGSYLPAVQTTTASTPTTAAISSNMANTTVTFHHLLLPFPSPYPHLDLPDLVEDDVWSTIEHLHLEQMPSPDPPRPPHPPHRLVGGLSLVFEDSPTTPPSLHFRREELRESNMAASAPVDVPNWSGVGRTKQLCWPADVEYVDDGDVGEEMGWMPPHEYVQHGKGGGTVMATSVLEGMGRTLKGRDLSRVRNAVWRETGFIS